MNYTSKPLRQGLKLLQSHSHCKFSEVKITFKCRRESHKLLFDVKGTVISENTKVNILADFWHF